MTERSNKDHVRSEADHDQRVKGHAQAEADSVRANTDHAGCVESRQTAFSDHCMVSHVRFWKKNTLPLLLAILVLFGGIGGTLLLMTKQNAETIAHIEGKLDAMKPCATEHNAIPKTWGNFAAEIGEELNKPVHTPCN
jgi:hypothetical protein